MITIHITNDDLEKIARWNGNNRDKRIKTSGKFPYSLFRLSLIDKKAGEYGYDVNLIDNEVSRGIVKYHSENGQWHFRVFDGFEEIDKELEKVENPKADDVTTHYRLTYGCFMFIMAYLQHKMSKRKTILVEGNSKVASGKKNSSKRVAKTKDTFLLDDFIVYEHKNNTGITHTYTCESWGVKGHYRHYKSGKVVFVKEYTKGKNKGINTDKDVYLRKVR